MTYSLNVLFRDCHKPVIGPWVAARTIKKYIKGNKDFGLCFKKDETQKSVCTLTAISDVDLRGPEFDTSSSNLGKSSSCQSKTAFAIILDPSLPIC
jgi:hypothetical protein